MAIAILNKFPQKVKCKRCGTRFLYEKEDIVTIFHEDFWGREIVYTETIVDCPICARAIEVKIK